MTQKVTDAMLEEDYVKESEIGGSVGTVTSVDVDDAVGITFTGGPIVGAGVLTPALSANLQAWHALATSAKQNADSTLTALAAYNTNGILTQTAADTFVGRTITGTAGRVTVTNGDGVSGNPTLNIPTTLLDSDTYSPTITGVANVASSATHTCAWLRVGNTVQVSGAIDITPTATTTLTQARLSLPVASNFASSWECSGSAAIGQGPVNAGLISADSTNDQALLTFTSTGTTLVRCFFSFGYQVI